MTPALRLRSGLHRLVVAAAKLERVRGGWRVARMLGRLATRLGGDVVVPVHGRPMRFNLGHPYLVFARNELYNAVLVEAARAQSSRKGRPIVVIDVGAGFGDTFSLLMDRAGDAVELVHCIEPEPMFFEYLVENVGDEPRARTYSALLGDGQTRLGALERHHAGTASATGFTHRSTGVRLDQLIADPIDLIKVDTDGFDGIVLRGATALLAARPAVVFEFHPVLADRAGNDAGECFDVLRAAGYRSFAVFDKTGPPVAVVDDPDPQFIAGLAERCRRLEASDYHYDVLAVAEGASGLRDAVALALSSTTSSRRRSTNHTYGARTIAQ